ncbi:MAG TPA: hypothetical protein VL171_00810 [Verrucomicrobiae bacterium]|nr:hypothetical protein [Verrucomicrobiae bacterium]
MTWPDAKTAAHELLALLDLPPEGRLNGYRIQLTEYADENVYRFACGGRHGWPLAYYHTVVEAMYRELRKRGAIVERHLVTRDQIVMAHPNPSTIPHHPSSPS